MVIGFQLEGFLSSSTVFGIRLVLHSLALLGIVCPYNFFGITTISWKVTFLSQLVLSPRCEENGLNKTIGSRSRSEKEDQSNMTG